MVGPMADLTASQLVGLKVAQTAYLLVVRLAVLKVVLRVDP